MFITFIYGALHAHCLTIAGFIRLMKLIGTSLLHLASTARLIHTSLNTL